MDGIQNDGFDDLKLKEVTSIIEGWSVTYPATCNGHLADMGFVFPVSGYCSSTFVHFDVDGNPYGADVYVPKNVLARLRAMRNSVRKVWL